MSASPDPLPVHGFVLAGGRSSRMGQDKATLVLHGLPLVQIAVHTLSQLCRRVSIAANRPDLAPFAPVVPEDRLESGPGAGVEAGLAASSQPWALFIPVDVPLVPADLLRRWCQLALRSGVTVSYLGVLGRQPAFCLLHRDRLDALRRQLDSGQRRLELLLRAAAAADGLPCHSYTEHDLYPQPGEPLPDPATLHRWLANLNTPEDLARLQASLAEISPMVHPR